MGEGGGGRVAGHGKERERESERGGGGGRGEERRRKGEGKGGGASHEERRIAQLQTYAAEALFPRLSVVTDEDPDEVGVAAPRGEVHRSTPPDVLAAHRGTRVIARADILDHFSVGPTKALRFARPSQFSLAALHLAREARHVKRCPHLRALAPVVEQQRRRGRRVRITTALRCRPSALRLDLRAEACEVHLELLKVWLVCRVHHRVAQRARRERRRPRRARSVLLPHRPATDSCAAQYYSAVSNKRARCSSNHTDVTNWSSSRCEQDSVKRRKHSIFKTGVDVQYLDVPRTE